MFDKMFNIEGYLKRVVGIVDKSVLYQKEIVEILAKHTGIDPNNKSQKDLFEIKEGVLRLNVSPLQKNVVFMKKEKILADLKSFGIIDIK
jgi:hypothetical protein